MDQVLLFAAVGFFAQVIDGALGMAFGLVSTSALLAFGVLPATASATVHLAEFFTTAASSTAHIAQRNVDFRILTKLAPAGVLGGILGAYVLTGIEGAQVRPFVVAYLALMGGLMLSRAIRPKPPRVMSGPAMVALGTVGGFADAIGGGGWGPLVSSTLMASGGTPRYVIGTVNAAEFILTTFISATFVFTFVSGRWADMGTLVDHAGAVAGMAIGGFAAAPVASLIVKRVPARPLTIAVACLILALCAYQGWTLIR